MTNLDNPFSPLAVARVARFDEVTIETDAVREAHAAVRGYLETRTVSAEGIPVHFGNVLALIGDYGTGKTHLVGWLLREVQRTMSQARTVYVDPSSDTFLDLYRSFLAELGPPAVQARVNELYADIVAASMENEGMTSDVVQWLKDREIEPRVVVERLGLTESSLLGRVEETLRAATGDEELSRALTLLLRPGFEEAVWQWLSGAPPEPILTDRGISKVIDSERSALDMLGSVIMLMGGEQRRFLLAVDEFHKLFNGRNNAETMDAFQKLLSVFSTANAFLILAGVPDALTVLPPGVQQRVGRIVTMPELSPDEVCQFIMLAQERQFGQARLSPFSRDVVAYLVSLAGGGARTVIRLCHELYRVAMDAQQPVSEAMVTEVARNQLGRRSVYDVPTEIGRILDGKGLLHQQDHVVGSRTDARADFWVMLADEAVCAILLTRSLLDSGDVREVERRMLAIRAAEAGAQFIVVVNGVVSYRVTDLVRQTFDHYPVVYRPGQFADDFQLVIDPVIAQIRQMRDENPIKAMQERIEHLHRQQSSVLSAIEQVVVQGENAQSAVNRSLTAIQRDLNEVVGVVHGSAVSGPDRSLPLPPDVDRLFVEPISLLDRLIELNGGFAGAFPEHPEDSVRAAEARSELQDLLRSSALLEANGAAAALRQAVIAFRQAVAVWYHSDEVRMSTEHLTDRADDELDSIGRAYSAIVEFVPIDRLEPLIRRGGRPGLVSGLSQSLRRADLDVAFDLLTVRVRRALLKSIFVRGR